jgi:monofunctional biosynthetic peptidoglycan transglycosylase
MADGKARNGGRLALGFALAAIVWLLGVWPPPFWWADHWPRRTAMMLRSQAPAVEPSALSDISPLLQRMVILGEDWRFYSHSGIDAVELKERLGVPRMAGFWETAWAAWRQRDRVRGTSTITQQLAKNLYFSPSRTALRKAKEAVTALRLERALTKDRILELYVNVAEWGPDVWGVQAASRLYFGRPPARLTRWQAATLAATLPHPRSSNPLHRPGRMAARRRLILSLLDSLEKRGGEESN